MMLAPARMLAWDEATILALIQDHKDVRAKMMVRSAVEEGNALLLQWENDTIKGYKKINDLLDKYDKYFDILDLILRGANTVIKLHRNYTTISDRIDDMRKLLTDFNESCLKTGKIEYSDKIIIDIGTDMIKAVNDDVENLYTSLKKILMYQGAGSATGLMAMSTKNLIEILDTIDQCFDHITKVINRSYIKLRGYILARLGPFFRRTLYRSRPVSEVAADALTRWLEVSRRASVVTN
jgi:hypothetical protein